MSLLMDALKKAEQEKREAAKRVEESEDLALKDQERVTDKDGKAAPENEEGTASPDITDEVSMSHSLELSLTPLDNGYTPRPVKTRNNTLSGRGSRIDEDEEDERESGPQLGASALELTLDGDRPAPGRDRGEGADEEDGDHDLKEEIGLPETGTDPDETFHGVDFDETDESPVVEEEDGATPRPGEGTGRFYEETLPGVPAVQLAEDMGGLDQPTPVAAQTVFTAGNSTNEERSSAFRWILAGSTVVMMVAAGIWYYYAVTPINRELPSPMVARGIETIQPITSEQRQQVQSAVPGGGGVETPPAQQAPAAGPAQSAPEARAPDSGSPDPANTGVAADSMAASGSPDTTREPPAPTPAETSTAASSPPPAPPEEAPADFTAAAPGRLPDAIQPPTSLIRITRSRTLEERGSRLRDAYAAYSSGNYASAAGYYEQVLEQDPENRDALLGLAAIAVQRDELPQAVRVYARLLELNPRDNLARAALINLGNLPTSEAGESSIKLMLEDNPDLAYLHFALGNLYAKQSRWPEAQQAFFDAWRLDSNSPDFALNLAVSLDRLGKPAAALEYYRTALRLADAGSRPANFEPADLESRIRVLEGSVNR